MREQSRNHSVLALLLGMLLVLSGCRASVRWSKAGPLFATEMAPPAKAVVYVYWPKEMRGRATQVFVRPCGNLAENKTVLRGGYASFVVEPGPGCFEADTTWDFPGDHGFAIEELGKAQIRSEAGHGVFLRVEPRKGFLDYHDVLRRMAPEAAEPEIRRCRRTVPLAMEEIPTGG